MAEAIKSFKVHPDYASEEINYRQRFGWEFVSTQEIYNKDTHLLRKQHIYGYKSKSKNMERISNFEEAISKAEKTVINCKDRIIKYKNKGVVFYNKFKNNG